VHAGSDALKFREEVCQRTQCQSEHPMHTFIKSCGSSILQISSGYISYVNPKSCLIASRDDLATLVLQSLSTCEFSRGYASRGDFGGWSDMSASRRMLLVVG
jgi:hypothetical protein